MNTTPAQIYKQSVYNVALLGEFLFESLGDATMRPDWAAMKHRLLKHVVTDRAGCVVAVRTTNGRVLDVKYLGHEGDSILCSGQLHQSALLTAIAWGAR